ncbi:MAG: hypothetical protein OHK0039_17150 [Bacteroidia bacterium]
MTTRVTVQAIYRCSLERAFKTPMLCDISKVHTGFGILPRVIRCTDDANWGQPGSSKKVISGPSLTFKGGESSIDRVLERIENSYWKIEVSEFKTWMLGFTRFVGEWKTTELETDRVQIDYTYTLHSKTPLLYPVNWLFAKTFWRIYMRRVLENVRKMAEGQEPYQHA